MTARSTNRLTLEEVVAENIKALRAARRDAARTARGRREWTPTAVANRLTELTGRKYTRHTVYDLEGRRERQIRWVELAALCEIFDVALWDLVLPPEGVEVDTTVTTGDVIRVELPKPLEPVDKLVNAGEPNERWVKYVDPATATDDQVGVMRYDPPQRDELSWRFFNLPAKDLEKAPRKYWEEEKEKREGELHTAMGKAIAVFREELETEE